MCAGAHERTRVSREREKIVKFAHFAALLLDMLMRTAHESIAHEKVALYQRQQEQQQLTGCILA